MTDKPENTADKLPIDPRLANLKKGKPFKKGFDVRRNLRGVPKGTAEFRTHMRKIAAELIGKDETEMTRYEAMCRMFFTSRNPAHNKLALQVLDPKILSEHIDLTSGGEALNVNENEVYERVMARIQGRMAKDDAVGTRGVAKKSNED